MIPQKDQHVKCFLRSSAMLEGTVEEWSDNQVVLKSMDGQSIMILHCPTEDILMTKVILHEQTTAESSEQPLPEIKEQIREKLHETLKTTDPELNQMNLKQLRQLAHEQDKQIIKQKTKEHFGSPGASKMAVQYSPPFAMIAKKE